MFEIGQDSCSVHLIISFRDLLKYPVALVGNNFIKHNISSADNIRIMVNVQRIIRLDKSY